jgi:hypothetical protein
VKVTVVAPATTRRCDRVVLYVMYLCCKMMIMYFCVKTIWSVVALCLELELLLFCCVNMLYVICFGGFHSGRQPKQKKKYKNNIFLG